MPVIYDYALNTSMGVSHKAGFATSTNWSKDEVKRKRMLANKQWFQRYDLWRKLKFVGLLLTVMSCSFATLMGCVFIGYLLM